MKWIDILCDRCNAKLERIFAQQAVVVQSLDLWVVIDHGLAAAEILRLDVDDAHEGPGLDPETVGVEFLLYLADQFLHVRATDREPVICPANAGGDSLHKTQWLPVLLRA